MKVVAGVLCAAGILLFIWTATHQLPGTPPPGAKEQAGFPLYRKHCARCHGLGGQSRRASQMAHETVSLVDPEFKDKLSRDELRRVIVEGKGKMEGLGPAFPRADLEHLLDFVQWMPADSKDTSQAGALR